MRRMTIAGVGLSLVLLAACSSGGTSWTYAPVADDPGPRVAVAEDDSTATGASPPPAEATSGVEPGPAASSAAGEQPSPDEPADPGAAEGSAEGDLEVIEIRGFDLGYDPASPSVPEPGRYLVRFVNDGAIYHDIAFDDGTVIGADPGQTAEGEVEIPAGGLGFICSVPGHGPAGMVGSVTVESGSEEGDPAQDPTQDPAQDPPQEPYGPAEDGAAAAAHDEESHGGPAPATDVAADPDAPAPVTFDATAPARLEGAVHDIDLVMTEELMTVAPGFVQQVWTFGGTVPGPVIRVKVGDTIRVHLINPPENAVSHSLDFHSSQVAWNDEMRSIAPGEELIYEWTAEYAGVWMYHCGTAPTLHHIANGMYGMVIVEPAEGLPPADSEFALVQSEWYLGPQGEVTSLEKAMAAAPEPDFVVFNGVANQYEQAPLEVETGERARIFVLNAGPSVDSSFHIVGTIFDTVVKEGVHLAKGNEGSWGSQAVDLAPAQGAIVEFTTAEDGLYPVVTHAFNFVGRGALGLVQAGDGDPTN